MANTTTATCLPLFPSLEMAWRDVDSSFERFCLTAGIGAVEQMLRQDAQGLTGAPHSRGGGRAGHRWGTTEGKIGFHGGKVTVHRPRVRSFDGHEVALPSWTAAQAEDWLGRWAMNLMLINVSTRKLRRAVRLPEGDLPIMAGDGTSKSAASRRFVALSAERLAEWMASDLSKLDLLIIQIDGLHIGNDLVLVAALGIDGNGDKHPLGLVEGATENTAVLQALQSMPVSNGFGSRNFGIIAHSMTVGSIPLARSAARASSRPCTLYLSAWPWSTLFRLLAPPVSVIECILADCARCIAGPVTF